MRFRSTPFIRRLPPLLAALLVCWLLGWLPAEAWLCVPLFFLPGCACCAFTCSSCAATTQHGQMQVTISGMTNSSCSSCNDFNATFIVNVISTSSCFYTATISSCGTGTVQFNWGQVGTDWVGTGVNVYTTSPSHVESFSNLDTSSGIDCGVDPSGIVFVNTFGSGARACDGSSATVSVVVL